MASTQALQTKLRAGDYDHVLNRLYGAEQVSSQRERYSAAIVSFEALFGPAEEAFLFSAPGRTEIGGNHTDHNHGRVLAGSINLDVIAVVARDTDTIRVKSEGFPQDTVSLSDLSAVPEEAGTSAAILRGLTAGFVQNGHAVGGYRAYTTSQVLKGSGLSSSAAFEVLNGTILSFLYNNGTVRAEEIAQLSQFAETAYFGKPCGLMDQMACAIGGIIAIDFADPQKPIIERVNFDFSASMHKLCIVDTGGNHADLTHEYAAVPADMKAVATLLGKTVLRECREEDLVARLPEIRERLGDRAALRALHFFAENQRVEEEVAALKNGDFDRFKQAVLASGHSSFEYLQNVYPASAPAFQGLSVALCLSQRLLDGTGAWRVHGGGFAGTTQNFVPNDKLAEFVRLITAVFGENSCYTLSIRPCGSVCLDQLL